ncbi:transcriptional regulator [Hyphomicrobium methylovorum]|uniref:RrF2 family transcriptional regulator n=1 Tax=Hyphomicrobium methylovorum TaxID=84 RepID=UPI0015E71795|nr:Rrf2 family transcriptional regulator [Hyphomicrobium methylovorum]MBA2125414.1 transcriptional regulator [Hyphomicrobium methylovorum]
MKMSDGVEWTAHACVLLSALPAGRGLPANALAEFHALPPAYMAKHMQALARAGIVDSIKGPTGGYRLARPASAISLWDIVSAIEGDGRAFRCSEIRQQGPCGGNAGDFRRPCGIHAVFNRAETAWRAELRAVSIGDLAAAAVASTTARRRDTLQHWLTEKLA